MVGESEALPSEEIRFQMKAGYFAGRFHVRNLEDVAVEVEVGNFEKSNLGKHLWSVI